MAKVASESEYQAALQQVDLLQRQVRALELDKKMDCVVVEGLQAQLKQCEDALQASYDKNDLLTRMVRLPILPSGRKVKAVNINQYVHARLNDRGLALLRKHLGPLERHGYDIDEAVARFGPDENGYYQFQLWEFMHYYGAASFNGCDPCFDITVGVETSLPI